MRQLGSQFPPDWGGVILVIPTESVVRRIDKFRAIEIDTTPSSVPNESDRMVIRGEVLVDTSVYRKCARTVVTGGRADQIVPESEIQIPFDAAESRVVWAISDAE